MIAKTKKRLYILGVVVGAATLINLFLYRHSSIFFRFDDPSGSSSLHWAAWDGRTSAVKKLLAKGADVNCRAKDGSTPLHDAAFCGHKEAIKVLIANGADVNAVNSLNKTTPLHLAAATGRPEIVRVLLAAGADPTARNRNGYTPLEWAEKTVADLSYLDRLLYEKRTKACIEVLSKHAANSLRQVQPASVPAPSVTLSQGNRRTRRFAVTRIIFLIGGAVYFFGYIWIAVIGFRKDVAWGFGCLFAPVNLAFAVQNWSECKAAFMTSIVGFAICLFGFVLGPTIDMLIIAG